MCGRLNVTRDPLAQLVSSALDISFNPATNTDLRPTQRVATVATNNKGMIQQLDASWGIKPTWSKALLINAQAETVAVKPTFKQSFSRRRCVVPISGWYEWSAKGGTKSKYGFTTHDMSPLYMAGIWYEPEDELTPPKLVTLTTNPNDQCREYHHRMPLLLAEQSVIDWVLGDVKQAVQLLITNSSQNLRVSRS